jgi:protein-S-isoprenylcysteine O-methyltransferase Ste14
MQLFPVLKLAWLNGWILIGAFYAIFGLTILQFPRDVVNRLYDETGWSRRQRIMSTFAKLTALISFVLIFLSPLKIGTGVFTTGVLLYALGTVLMVAALINFRKTPLRQPVAGGLYRFSRNPQWVALVLVLLGIAVAIGSWTVVFLTAAVAVFGHYRILAEEQTCLDQYGEAYRKYAKRVPRYFWIFSGELVERYK